MSGGVEVGNVGGKTFEGGGGRVRSSPNKVSMIRKGLEGGEGLKKKGDMMKIIRYQNKSRDDSCKCFASCL